MTHLKSTGSKSKNRQVGLHQTKKLCTVKETINRVKRQSMGWENIFANHISDKALISKISKSQEESQLINTSAIKNHHT